MGPEYYFHLQASAECPSCGRFVGPYATCPQYRADVGQRLALRTFKIGSLVLAIAGVVVLLLVASRVQPPVGPKPVGPTLFLGKESATRCPGREWHRTTLRRRGRMEFETDFGIPQMRGRLAVIERR
jgi:hypothetical protein